MLVTNQKYFFQKHAALYSLGKKSGLYFYFGFRCPLLKSGRIHITHTCTQFRTFVRKVEKLNGSEKWWNSTKRKKTTTAKTTAAAALKKFKSLQIKIFNCVALQLSTFDSKTPSNFVHRQTQIQSRIVYYLSEWDAER